MRTLRLLILSPPIVDHSMLPISSLNFSHRHFFDDFPSASESLQPICFCCCKIEHNCYRQICKLLLLICYRNFTVVQSQALCNCSKVCCHQISSVLVNRANHFRDRRNQIHPNAEPEHFALNQLSAANL